MYLPFLVDSESNCRYVRISIKCHIPFGPFVLAQSFQTLFLPFVPFYISLNIVLFANFEDVFFIFPVVDKKKNVEYPKIERERERESELK